LLDLATGDYRRISGPETFAYEGTGNLPVWDAKGRFLWLEGQRGATTQIVTLSEEDGGWRTNGMTSLDRSVAAAALASRANVLVFTASSPVELPALFRQDLREAATVQAEPNADLPERWQIATVEDAGFTGPDGDAIEAWAYPVPSGTQDAAVVSGPAGRVPLVVYYYGGSVPTTRGFNPTHQFLRANGYAVLVVNPRGAAGYGDAFADYHAGDWGPAAAADIIAGVEAYLRAHPEVDPARVGIYGGSYGGFLTEYLVSVTDMFAAAVSMYGISDLATYWGQGVWGWTYGDMALGGRSPWHDPDYFVAHSPLFRADNITTPLLLLHGESDTNVTTGESRQLFTALSLQGTPVELVTFPGEEHGISGTWENRVAHRTMMLEWFDSHLRDEPEAWRHRWR
jgi:dipeptidyl aminopeptidase/acylaminoacyl peptidase